MFHNKRQRYHALNNNNIPLRLNTIIKKLKGQCRTVKQEKNLALRIARNPGFHKIVREIPKNAFRNFQLERGKQEGNEVTTEDKILALTVLQLRPTVYNLMREILSLPSKKYMKKILKNILIRPGLNRIQDLTEDVKTLSSQSKLCILMFGEISLSPGIRYNETLDKIIGYEDFAGKQIFEFADHALLFMIKGVKHNYKQVVSFSFCNEKKLSSTAAVGNYIIDVIKELHKTGLRVVALVCDPSATNIQVINKLIDGTKQKYLPENKDSTSLAFEVDENKIFPLFNPPYLIKELRNTLLNHDLRFTKNGKVMNASWEHINMLFEKDDAEDDMRLVNKLTEYHINKDKIPKTTVKHAAQVFSQRAASALNFLACHGVLPMDCLGTAQMLLMVDKLFDSFNGHSREIDDGKQYKCALWKTSPHFELWDQLLPILKGMQMRVEENQTDGTVKTYFRQVPVLEHWIHNIHVFKEMFMFLNQKHNITSIFTRNFNKEPLDNLIYNIKSQCHKNASLTCSQFIRALQLLILNNFRSPHFNDNCKPDNNRPLQNIESLLNQRNDDEDSDLPSDSELVLFLILSNNTQHLLNMQN